MAQRPAWHHAPRWPDAVFPGSRSALTMLYGAHISQIIPPLYAGFEDVSLRVNSMDMAVWRQATRLVTL